MPLNVRRFFASVLLSLSAIAFINAQIVPSTTTTTPTTAAPTSAEVMRDRVAKAKAFIVVKNYNAAIYELENIRRETKDPNINAMLNVLLMHSYLEQSDYKRAQDFLETLHKELKTNKPNASMNYYSVAGQVVKGARTQIDRYKSVGLTVSDRNLPLEAIVDIDKMRETLEKVITQSKDLGADKKQTATALPLLEEAINARSSLAKDEYDANRWKLEVADAREGMVNSRSTIINAVDGTSDPVKQTTTTTAAAVPQNTIAANIPTSNPSIVPDSSNQTTTQTPTVINKTPESVPSFQPVQTSAEKTNNVQPNVEETNAKISTPKQTEPVANAESQRPNNQRQRLIVGQTNQPNANSVAKQNETKTETTNQTVANTENVGDAASPMTVGSLVEFATKRVSPQYPPQARTMRMSGIVKVEVTIDEEGKVTEVQNTNGPSMLQRSAIDAVKKWQFKPFTRNGQPTKATGFVNFNFTL